METSQDAVSSDVSEAPPEQPTEGAHPRLVLTRVPEASGVLSTRMVLAGIVALTVTAETGRWVGASPRVTLVCSVAALGAVVMRRAGRTRGGQARSHGGG
ncbi:hypothetical protein [Actinomadura sp. WMMB 499]|uniref:hypothetical protein n=1 Tax=Actinomadura sp. WMMB 499 TaxID=1219491 RepID=UPI0012467BC2|nr:hypothetical protein [Actinomadura sp. WMMB 499]QFG25306.1 hypothetical protein F7P10_33310 [Actinomadura sp. WMMB 499]